MRSEKVVRKKLADGTVKEYRYNRDKPRAGRNAPGTIGALLEAYRGSPEWRAMKPNTKASYGRHFLPLDVLAEQPVASLRRRVVLELRDAIAATRGPASATKFVRTASALMAWAVDREWIEINPLTRIRSLPGGHLRAWTEAEYDRVLPSLPPHLRRALVLARYTGQRRGDLISMPWSAYDGATIRLRQLKTGAAMVIPAATHLREELESWGPGEPSATILTTERGRPWLPAYLSSQIGEAVAAVDPSLSGLNIHGLRKLAAAELAEAGCSTKEIAAITGHQTLAMVELYTISARQAGLAESAVSRVETARGNRRKLPI